MAINLQSAQLKLVLSSTFQNVLDLDTVSDALSQIWQNDLTNGTGANKGQVVWHDERTLAAGTPESLDLAGALACAFGVITFSKVKLIAIKVVTTTPNYRLEVGGAAANQFINWVGNANDVIIVGAGGLFCLSSPVDGYAVTGGTGDLLKINNPSAGGVTYDIWVVGEGSVA
jgi:hypothetical protein